MRNVERLSITLPRDMAQMIRDQVADGRYASNSEVIREAMRIWQETNAARIERLAHVRAAIAEAEADPRPNLSERELDAHFEARLARSRAEAGEHG